MRKLLTKILRQAVYDKCQGHCAYCGCELEYKDMQVDHIKAVQMGGDDSLENLLPSCRMCNFYKSTYSIEKFREQLTKLLYRLEKVYIFRLSKKYKLLEETHQPVIFYFEKSDRTEIEELLQRRTQAGKDACAYDGAVIEWLEAHNLSNTAEELEYFGPDGCMLTTEPDAYND